MAEDAIKEVYSDMLDQIGAGASAGGVVAQVAFTEFFCEFLSSAVHHVADLTPAYFFSRWKNAEVRVDAYYLDEQTYDLTLVVSDFVHSQSPEDMATDNAFDDLKRKNRSFESEFTIWDFLRYYDAVTTMNPSADITVDCSQYFDGRGLPFLTSSNSVMEKEQEYQAYLMMLPGKCVYDWYARYADRLLEQNVRTFLQFKGKINRGIRSTLNSNPTRFLAYNNGLTATAESVELDPSGKCIVSIKNLQIVNGGQTTASIYSAYSANGNDEMLESISVQMKLIVASGPNVEDLVGNISRFANSQNKIKDTDFVSNHPFMKRLENFSRRLTANPGGTLRGTRWFFERTRGQYLNNINLLQGEAERNKFKKIYPKDQVFTKSDMAKYLLSWDWAPWIVARGAEKAFVQFAERKFGSDPIQRGRSSDGTGCVPGRERIEPWDKRYPEGNPQFNEQFYYELVGKAMLYRQLDKILRKCEWCKGYKSQILTYTISLLRKMLSDSRKSLNFRMIWEEQSLPQPLLDYMVEIAHEVMKVITETADGRNVSEWTKHSELWLEIKRRFRHERLSECLMENSVVISIDDLVQVRRQSCEKQESDNDEWVLNYIIDVEDSVWTEMRLWIESHKFNATRGEEEALRTRDKVKDYLTPEFAKKLLQLWRKVADAGFPHPPIGA